jgi:uncharacterized membrane protein YqjE
MVRQGKEGERPGVTDLVSRLVDGLGQLLAQHVALARIELGEEARSVARALGTMALFVPLLVVGYAMLCFGLAFALSPLLGTPGAVALVGGMNLVAGGAGLWRVRSTLRRPALESTTEAFRESAHALASQTRREVPGVH